MTGFLQVAVVSIGLGSAALAIDGGLTG